MISLAWSISLLLCIPQAVIFQGDSCKAHFEGQNSEDYPNWGLKTYIIWFSLSNFFIPLVILFYCYTRICYVIWENGKQRRDFSPVKDESTSDNCFKVLTRFAQWDILLYYGYLFYQHSVLKWFWGKVWYKAIEKVQNCHELKPNTLGPFLTLWKLNECKNNFSGVQIFERDFSSLWILRKYIH